VTCVLKPGAPIAGEMLVSDGMARAMKAEGHTAAYYPFK
jgi:hypothetical protein